MSSNDRAVSHETCERKSRYFVYPSENVYRNLTRNYMSLFHVRAQDTSNTPEHGGPITRANFAGAMRA